MFHSTVSIFSTIIFQCIFSKGVWMLRNSQGEYTYQSSTSSLCKIVSMINCLECFAQRSNCTQNIRILWIFWPPSFIMYPTSCSPLTRSYKINCEWWFLCQRLQAPLWSQTTWEALRTHCRCKHFQTIFEVLHVTENSKPLKIKKEILASLLTETCVPVWFSYKLQRVV